MTVYKKILLENLPTLLNLYDQDPLSDTFGVGDRLHWGWKVSDFANATLQGGVHSLAIAIQLNLVDKTDEVLSIIDSAIRAIPKIATSKGSLQEAYPKEHSWCVTALVAFDTLSAIKYLGDRLNDSNRREYLEIVRPLIDFITNNNEEHAIISNHLATGLAAIVLWNELAGESNQHWKILLRTIKSHQSEEGWHKEYESADPGYSTLCLYYLASAALSLDGIEKKEVVDSINSAAEYLQYFIHPDNTIGGLYGSRNTEVYYPGGIVALADDDNTLGLMVAQLQTGIEEGSHLLPQHIDIGNFIPCINSYAMAAWHTEQSSISSSRITVPSNTSFTKNFEQAGIYIHSNDTYYAIVNYKKGGTVKVFNKLTGKLDCEDGGLVGTLSNGKKVSTQVFQEGQTFEQLEMTSSFYQLNNSAITPFKTIIIRLMSLTIFRSVGLGNLFKKQIVKLLMTGKRKVNGEVKRKFDFQEHKIIVSESVSGSLRMDQITHPGKFKSIHMASSGYHLPQHFDSPLNSQIISFIWA